MGAAESPRWPASPVARSPQLAHRHAVENLGEARAGGAGCVIRQRAERKKAVLDDLAVGLGQRGLAEVAHDVERDMIAARGPLVEIKRVQLGCGGELDVALFGELTRER